MVGPIIGLAIVIPVFIWVVISEVRGSSWFQAYQLGRAVQQSDAVIRQAASAMRQLAAESRSGRQPPSWRDW